LPLASDAHSAGHRIFSRSASHTGIVAQLYRVLTVSTLSEAAQLTRPDSTVPLPRLRNYWHLQFSPLTHKRTLLRHHSAFIAFPRKAPATGAVTL